MGRLVIYFPTITAFIAFILTLLCLFAGTQLTVLPGVDIFTVGLSGSGLIVSGRLAEMLQYRFFLQNRVEIRGYMTSTPSM